MGMAATDEDFSRDAGFFAHGGFNLQAVRACQTNKIKRRQHDHAAIEAQCQRAHPQVIVDALRRFARETDYFDPAEIEELIRRRRFTQMWYLYNFVLWWKRYIAREPVTPG